MCGIVGIYRTGKPVDLAVAQRALTAIRHRGPDDEGYLAVGLQAGRAVACTGPDSDVRLRLPSFDTLAGESFDVVLGHRRLSILDLSPAGHQPMASPDGRYWIVYNGEVYNYLELRTELAGLGHQFHTGTDTEVILAAYAQWGAQALPRFAGMFAFAILDLRERKLFLARDFFGIKPLYYTLDSAGLSFASEIKALLQCPWVSRRANPQRLYQYLRFGQTDHGSETMFADIRQLPVAHYLEVSLDAPATAKPVRYWQVKVGRPARISFDDAAEQLQSLFLENIRLHLRSDVPVGSCLSGGIDSSSIVMGMRRLHGDDLDLHTFSFIADDPVVGEEKHIDVVGQAARASMHKTMAEPDDLLADLDDLVHTQGQPFGGTSIYAQYRVFRLVKETGIKVMLDGQGADELMAGYHGLLGSGMCSLLRNGHLLAAHRFHRHLSALPGVNPRRVLFGALGRLLPVGVQPPMRRLVGEELVPEWLDSEWFSRQGVVAAPKPQPRGRHLLREELWLAVSETSLPALLRYEDCNSMRYSIESRVPFLTAALVEFVLSLPGSYLLTPDACTKAVFRRAMRGITPDSILDRKDKIGFATPEQRWMVTLRPWIEQVLASETAASVGALRLDAARRELDAVFAGHKRFDLRIWRWLNLIRWAEQYQVRMEG